MSLYATNTSEVAVEAALGALREEAAAAERQPERIAGAVSTLVGRWRRLDRTSPYRAAAVEEALSILGELIDEGSSELAEARAELVLLTTRQEIAGRLREGRARAGYSVRAAAERCGMAASYLSELEGGRSGLPAEEVCARLESALGVDVADLARGARAEVEAAREKRRTRRAVGPAAPIGADPRLASAIAALSRDRRLLELVEDVEQLSPGAKAAVVRLARELASA